LKKRKKAKKKSFFSLKKFQKTKKNFEGCWFVDFQDFNNPHNSDKK
jgi:hypothetical protein